MSVTTSVDVSADPAAVWAVIAAPASLGTWVTSHVGFVGTAPEDLDEGTEYTERIKVMGMPNDVHWTVTQVEQGRRFVQEAQGPMGIRIAGEYSVETLDSGARVTVAQTFSGPALFAVKGQLERDVKAAQEASLAKLKGLIEGA